MKKKYLVKLGIFFSSIMIIFYVLFINSIKESIEDVNSLSEIFNYNDLISYIGQNIQEEGYGKNSLDYTILPGKKVEIVIKLADKNIDEQRKIEVQQIAIDSITAYNYDPQFFRIAITNYAMMY
ncbi:hypothetical protein [Bacillus sp. FJAT-22090]|uniref:hypothetical protein n=1 Tax=Bacillus sp. FJAT-22090 TaxID=1581038 RepID=UPI0011A195AE|nr:hypothetical protein [Bacillus sp. FJAT-22090]